MRIEAPGRFTPPGVFLLGAYTMNAPKEISIQTRDRTELIDVTANVQACISERGITGSGIVVIFVPHTTAAVTLNECADPAVKSDILSVLNRIIPWEMDYRHLEGNSAAHVKSTLVGASVTVAIENGRLILGTWQGIFFCEFDGPRTRKIHLHFLKS